MSALTMLKANQEINKKAASIEAAFLLMFQESGSKNCHLSLSRFQ
jgi:hypothetical protein